MTPVARQALQAFPWPRQDEGIQQPTWTDEGFTTPSGLLGPALFADSGQSGWSDDLNRLLDEHGNEFHPITKASRSFALKALTSLPEGAVVLEIGSSSPGLIRFLASQRPDLAFIGSDYLASSSKGFLTGDPIVPFIQQNILAPTLPEQSVDAIILLNVLEHIEKHDAALRHIARLLRPGGLVHIEVPAGPNLLDFYDVQLQHFRRYTSGDLSRLADSCGLQIFSSGRIGRWAFLPFWCVKKWNRCFPPTAATRDLQVAKLNSATAISPLLKLLFFCDGILPLPCGIRCWATGRKSNRLG